MSTTKVIILLIFCSLLGAIAGAGAGYYAALTTPTSSSIAVLDIEGMSRQIDPNSPNAALQAQAIAEQSKVITSRLVSAGIVVIDRANVIGAPDDAIIHVQVPAK